MKAKLKIASFMIFLGALSATYSCDDDPEVVLSGEKDILSFTVPGQTGPPTLNASNLTVVAEVENGTALTSLTPTFTLSSGATSDPVSETTGDYSSAVTITVTAEDATTQDWTVNVTEAPPAPSDETNILTFLLEDQTKLATIDQNNHTVAIEVVIGTVLTDLTPTFSLSPGATSVPVSGIAGDYSSDVTIAVTAEDATTTQNWTITVEAAAAGVSTGTDILSFSMPEQSQEPVIDGDNHQVFVEVSDGTVLTALTPTFILSPGATSVPVSGTAGDYSSNVTIAVTAEDGITKQDWIVEVYLEEEFDASIFCDENLCTDNVDLQQECQDFLLACLATQGQEDYDECLISALLFCKE